MIVRNETPDGQQSISFILDLDQDVSVVGDFNGWDPHAHPLIRDGSGHRVATVPLAPGSYAFRYLAEGGRFFDDPQADSFADNGYGETHGVVDVMPSDGTPKKVSSAPPAKKPHSV
jgi:1,4-alpha-glucan branching enzyme